MSCVVGVGVDAAPAKSVCQIRLSNALTDSPKGLVLTSNQLSPTIACILPELAHDGETFDTQINLFLDVHAVWPSAVFSAMLPQSCSGEYNREDEVARQSAQIINVLSQNGGNFLRSDHTYSNGHVFGC